MTNMVKVDVPYLFVIGFYILLVTLFVITFPLWGWLRLNKKTNKMLQHWYHNWLDVEIK